MRELRVTDDDIYRLVIDIADRIVNAIKYGGEMRLGAIAEEFIKRHAVEQEPQRFDPQL